MADEVGYAYTPWAGFSSYVDVATPQLRARCPPRRFANVARFASLPSFAKIKIENAKVSIAKFGTRIIAENHSKIAKIA